MPCTALESSVKPGDIYIMKERHFWREFRNRVWNTLFCHLGRRIGWVFPRDTIFHDRRYQYKVGINEVTRGRFQNSNNVHKTLWCVGNYFAKAVKTSKRHVAVLSSIYIKNGFSIIQVCVTTWAWYSPKFFFSNRHCFSVKFFGLTVFSQALTHWCQVVITFCYNGITSTECFCEKL